MIEEADVKYISASREAKERDARLLDQIICHVTPKKRIFGVTELLDYVLRNCAFVTSPIEQ